MSGVDVLAVMDYAETVLRLHGYGESANNLRQARFSVVDLIEAATAYRESGDARGLLNHALRQVKGGAE